MSGCGAGGSSSGTNSNPPPQASEFLYAKSLNGVAAFQIDLNSGNLNAIQTVPWTTSTYGVGTPQSQVQLVATPSGNFLYAIDINAEAVDAFTVGPNGQLSLVGGSPFSVSGFSPFLSGLAIDPTGVAVYAVDALDDKIVEFQINPTTGALTISPNFYFIFGGIAQAIVDPGGNSLYVTNEDLGNASNSAGDQGVDGFSITPASGNLAPLATSPYIIPIIDSSDELQPTEIAINPSGSFVYVGLGNYLPDSGGSIAGFTRDSVTGALTLMAGSPFPSESSSNTSVTFVSSISVDPSGKFLYALNMNDSSVSAFNINPQTGNLTSVAGSPFKAQAAPAYTQQGPLAVDPSGQYLYVLINPSAMAIYKINQSTGALSNASGSPESISPAEGISMTIVQNP